MLYLLISHMKSDDIFTCPNMAKNDLFDMVFSVVCVVLQQKLYKKITVTEKPFDIQNMSVNAIFPYLTSEKWSYFDIW